MSWNFGDLFDATARNVPADRPALIRGERVINWGDFDLRTNRLARAMLEQGLQPGDRVAIMARNIPEFIEIATAAFKARLTHVNVNYRYTTPEIAHVLRDCSASALFYQEEFVDLVTPLFRELSHLVLGKCIGGANDDYEALVRSGDGSPLAIERSPDDGYLLYTGGTTGKPKGVMWKSNDARRVQLEAPTATQRIETMDDHCAMVRNNPAPGRCIPACPLMHGAGLNSSMAELLAGGSAVLLPSDRFDAVELLDEIDRVGVTRVLIVGEVFARPVGRCLEEHPGRWDLSSMRVISSAGLMWGSESKRAMLGAMPQLKLVDNLGASEASGFGYALSTADHITETGYFTPAKNTVIIDSDSGRIIEQGETGQGWLARREPFASGYFGDPQKTAETYRTIDGVKYAVPGDMAEFDHQGRLRLLGRDSMCINTGGEKVFVEEVEEAVKCAPKVHDVMVVGVPDEQWGRRVVALLQVEPGYDEAGVRDALARELATYKIPKQFLVMDALPRHASGKGDYNRAQSVAADAAQS